MNCSGKHAGMLLACVTNGWSTHDYLQPDHQLQIAIKQTIERLCGEPVTFTTVDGCGAPLHMVSLRALAKMALALTQAPPDSTLGQVVAAMKQHPRFVAGEGRDTALFVEAIEGFWTKEGAEAVQVGALNSKGSFAFKIEDGAMRARAPLVGEILRWWGVNESALSSLAEIIEPLVFGGGVPHGKYRAVKMAY
jgi:L-asparaginase II